MHIVITPDEVVTVPENEYAVGHLSNRRKKMLSKGKK